MSNKCTLLIAAVAATFIISVSDPAQSQDMQSGKSPGMMHDSADHDMMGHGMMQSGTDQNMTGHGMMQCMKDDKGSGMMDHHSSGMMMGSRMMGSMMGSGMMGSGMMQGGTGSGMGALFGSRVTPIMNLSEGDVRSYLAVQLDRLNNKRLKIGDIKSDEGTVSADIVTVDNSLVQQLKVNRHTGAIAYEN